MLVKMTVEEFLKRKCATACSHVEALSENINDKKDGSMLLRKVGGKKAEVI